MEQLLSATLLYILIFGADFLFYVKLKDSYSYVSRRTYALFILGQICAIWYFYPILQPYIDNIVSELLLLAVFAGILFMFAYALIRDQLYVCSNGSRTLRCLTPFYVLVKGAEIVFQELIYLVIAVSLASLLGVNFLTYLAFTLILLIIHIVVIIGGGQSVVKSLTFGLFAISVPIFYIFIEMQLIWPAVYLHSIMYVFYWLMIADFDVKPGKIHQKVENSG